MEPTSSLVSGGPLTGSGGKILQSPKVTWATSSTSVPTIVAWFNSSACRRYPLTDSNFHDAIALWFDAEENATAIYGHISDGILRVTTMSNAFKDRTDFNEDIMVRYFGHSHE